MDNKAADSSLVQAKQADSLPLWTEILLNQHVQLTEEIGEAKALLQQSDCTLVRLDVRLKKIIKGILTHLELESFFLFPALKASEEMNQYESTLSSSFKSLHNTCIATQRYLHQLKFSYGNSYVSTEQAGKISHFLEDILQRLTEEDPIYSLANELASNTYQNGEKGVSYAV